MATGMRRPVARQRSRLESVRRKALRGLGSDLSPVPRRGDPDGEGGEMNLAQEVRQANDERHDATRTSAANSARFATASGVAVPAPPDGADIPRPVRRAAV